MTPPSGTHAALLPPDRVVLEPRERRDAVFDVIRSARSRLRLSLFRATDKGFFRELASAVDRGVAVEVLVTSRAKGGRRKLIELWERLEHTGAAISAYADPSVKYHAKYIVADSGPALITTMNFTKKCFTRTCDVVVITWDADVVSGLTRVMTSDRDGLPLPADLPARLIVGPEQSRRQMTSRIAQASSSVHVIDAKLSDPSIVDLLAERGAAGVDVRVHDGPDVGTLKSHGKMTLIDGRLAIVGSLALTTLSLDYRREVAIEITEPDAVAALEALFRRAWQRAPATSGRR